MKEKILKIRLEAVNELNHITIAPRNMTVTPYRNDVRSVIGNANCNCKKRKVCKNKWGV